MTAIDLCPSRRKLLRVGANGMDPARLAGRMSDVDCSEGESSCRSFG